MALNCYLTLNHTHEEQVRTMFQTNGLETFAFSKIFPWCSPLSNNMPADVQIIAYSDNLTVADIVMK